MRGTKFSAALAWALGEGGRTAEVARARMAGDAALVPQLWWFELRNGLIINERRGRITEQETARFLRRVDRMPIIEDRSPDETAVLALARRYRLTVYDAAYLELAQRSGLPLATLDTALARAAAAEGTALVGAEQQLP